MLDLEERVDNLEAMFGRFIINNDKTLRRLEQMMTDMRQQAEHDRQQAEQNRERADQHFAQMQQQMDQRFAQMQQQTDQRFAQMQQQTDQRFAQMQQRAEQDRRELNKKWGELANRLGTVAEDIVAPNLPRIAHEQFGCPAEPDDFMVRRWVRHQVDNSKRREFDVIVVYPEKVFINETKSTPRINYIDDFIAVMDDIHGYFPQYQGKTIIPIFAGLFIPDNLLRYLTKHKIYALGMGAETMELLNFELLNQPNLT